LAGYGSLEPHSVYALTSPVIDDEHMERLNVMFRIGLYLFIMMLAGISCACILYMESGSSVQLAATLSVTFFSSHIHSNDTITVRSCQRLMGNIEAGKASVKTVCRWDGGEILKYASYIISIEVGIRFVGRRQR
jgi:hypothetical protein